MDKINEMRIDFSALPENEAFARVAVGAFLLPLNPTMDEMEDVKTAVSEAVTNAIIHGYQNRGGMIRLAAELYEGKLVKIDIVDCGVGIEDVDRAREPLYTSSPEMERSGMGFTVMETFMDSLSVRSERGRGTTIHMEKRLGG
ncbi:MAG: anti-sigma F factor [Candidatus Spyradocola sp.]